MQLVLPHARSIADELVGELQRNGARAEVAGAARRGDELLDELVIVCDRAPSEVAAIVDAVDLELARGEGGLVGTLAFDQGAFPIRFRCTTERSFVEAVLRETGCDVHVAALEERAAARGATLSGLSADADDEESLYAALDLPYVSPELRDDGSLEAPQLISRIRGTFHVHTTWSDGIVGVAPMARAARTAGLEYVGISDHSRAASYANGLDPERLAQQRADVERARHEVRGVDILHGIECDILEDGTLDLPDDALATLDFVVVSVHSQLELDREAQTRRVVRALSNPLVTILAHPTARLLLGRVALQLDLDDVARAAARHGVFLEINTNAQRLDLGPELARRAAALGASFVIDPDAHEPRGLDTLPYGVLLARRARLDDRQVLNARPAPAVWEHLRARRAAALA
ncbi:MAG: hypothetical protein HYV09_31340 [Deltaproteobacteria bacterium]|nr:hypothetical protein [Deltaproteobacteria bacterium]